jgi:hypothetical protein
MDRVYTFAKDVAGGWGREAPSSNLKKVVARALCDHARNEKPRLRPSGWGSSRDDTMSMNGKGGAKSGGFGLRCSSLWP